MSSLPLTYAGLMYWDRTLALSTGQVRPDGVDLAYVSFPDPGELFRRQCQDAEFPASEMSTSSYVAMVSRSDDRFVGLPVFPSRHFRHADVYINADAGIAEPADLRGQTVGVLEYQMTAALWIRAFLQHDYGVRPSQISWVTGGLREPAFAERLAIDLPTDVSLERIPPDHTLEDMLETGEVAALVSAYPPVSYGQPGSSVRRLFPDHRAVERAYYKRTGILPIMHLVVVRRDVYEGNRWIARSLFDAFVEAQALGRERLHQTSGLAVSLPWLEVELEETRRVFGDAPFPYGVAANRKVLEALLEYAHQQGLAARALSVEELFAPETLDT